jgi:hypothetical protein
MHASPRRALLAIVAAAALTAGAAACGDDDDTAGGGGHRQPRAVLRPDGGRRGRLRLPRERGLRARRSSRPPSRRCAPITPPAEISDDWNRIIGALDEVTDLFGEIDLDDPSSFLALEEDEDLMQRFEDLEARFADLEEAGDRVSDYVRDECGIDLDGGETDGGETHRRVTR